MTVALIVVALAEDKYRNDEHNNDNRANNAAKSWEHCCWPHNAFSEVIEKAAVFKLTE